MWNDSCFWSRRSGRVLAWGLCGIALLIVSCRGARFPVCKDDSECADAKGKKCVDLRCVECRSDDECGDGRFCERKTQSCTSLGGPKPTETVEPPPVETTETSKPE